MFWTEATEAESKKSYFILLLETPAKMNRSLFTPNCFTMNFLISERVESV